MQEQAHLVGGCTATRRAVGREMGRPGLDVVFGLAAGAVDLLIDGAAANPVEAGDDEARVAALRPGLDPGDDAF